jgi:hypothetical protein
MFELTAKISNVSFDYFSGKPCVSFTFNEAQSARDMVDELKNHEQLTIKVGKFKKKRSLDANAYFHLLVNKIAAELSMSDDEAKRMLVKRYGTLARDEDGNLIGAMLPAGVDVDKFYPYTRDYKTEWRDGKEYTCYLFYERTRDLDTTQMSHLIQGTVDEAKCLGIEVKPEAEINSLLNQWRKSK